MTNVSARLPLYSSNGPPKVDFLDVYLTMLLIVRKFKNTAAMRIMFFWKCLKLNLNLKNTKKKQKNKNKNKNKKNEKNVFVSEINASENVTTNAYFQKRILVIDIQCVKKESQDFPYNSERLFQPELLSRESINMVKVLSFSFEQCFGPFNMLLVEGLSERGLFRHLSNHVFRSP